MKRPRLQTAFTLVELLVVMAVIGTLAAVTPPAMQLARTRHLAMAGNTVADLAHQARQHSTTRNVMTALILVTKDPSGTTGQDGSNRLFALAELAPGASSWEQISRWVSLPEGIMVDEANSAEFMKSPSLATPVTGLRHGGTSFPQDSLAFQVYLPGGRLMDNGESASPSLRIVQGVSDGGAAVNTAPDNYSDIILNRYTGIPKVERP